MITDPEKCVRVAKTNA